MTSLEQLHQEADDAGIAVYHTTAIHCSSVTITRNHKNAIGLNPICIRSFARETVVLAHELGHIKTNSLYDSSASINEVLRNEYRSWKWAIERLVPRDRLDRILHETDDNFWAAAEELEVTIEMIHRACRLYYGVEVAS